MGVIYSILNKANGKILIGQTRRPYKIRKTEHFSNLRNQRHENPYLQKAWNKYGEESFEFNIIEYCDDSMLNDNEEWWISYFNSTNQENGYNLQSGGDYNYSLNKEVCDKISNSHKGIKRSEETKLKISKSNSGKGNPFYGKHHSLDTKLLMSLKQNSTGYYHVYKENKSDVKQGFIWRYRGVLPDGSRKSFASVSLDKLKDKVISSGMEWYEIGNGVE